MKATGIVVEYNPFHNGHLHHLQLSKRISNADAVIAVMSGNFLQRGEPALVDKWTRAKMALLAGVDIIVELPYAFATQNAKTFAFGAISILEALRCESFCFGSESGDLDAFMYTVNELQHQNVAYEKEISKNIAEGMSYPSALSAAFKTLHFTKPAIDLSQPNNILGYHYIDAKQRMGASIRPLTIQRTQAGYHDEAFNSSSIASATSIRKALKEHSFSIKKVERFIPKGTAQELHSSIHEYGQLVGWEDFWPLLQYKLLTTNKEDLSLIYEMEEGVHHRIMDKMTTSNSFFELMENVKTKRYTWTRIQRMLLHTLTNTTKEEMNKDYPSYIRLLGMSDIGRQYLNNIKKDIELPLISKLSSVKKEDIAIDIRASRLYALGYKSPSAQQKLLAKDYSQPPLYVNKS
ncbi:nucleotidyltransferase [Bacillus spongiae]|uniref:tRNA(Met) cytidine acetate ligase n=1 Tax=Bacillus spongiae TaxID=2683610 RepID=A0ABU8HA80_9BACI